jgi:putative transposase
MGHPLRRGRTRRTTPRRWTQLGLQAARGTWGGLRRNSGRPRGRRTTVERTRRPALDGNEALHVTMRLRDGLPPLRRHHAYRTLRACFRRGKERFGFRLAHYSVQSNHLHLVCEADDRRALSRGVQGLAVRVARNLNRLLGRRGRLFADRYHLRVLRSPTETRNVLRYVLGNAVHHGALPDGPFFDTFSSAIHFDGWRPRPRLPVIDDHPLPIAAPRTWLLRGGWLRGGGPISLERDGA